MPSSAVQSEAPLPPPLTRSTWLAQTREEILKVSMAQNRVDESVNFTAITQELEGFTGSDIKEVGPPSPSGRTGRFSLVRASRSWTCGGHSAGPEGLDRIQAATCLSPCYLSICVCVYGDVPKISSSVGVLPFGGRYGLRIRTTQTKSVPSMDSDASLVYEARTLSSEHFLGDYGQVGEAFGRFGLEITIQRFPELFRNLPSSSLADLFFRLSRV